MERVRPVGCLHVWLPAEPGGGNRKQVMREGEQRMFASFCS